LGIPDHHVFTIRLEPDDHGVYTKVGHLEELIKDDGKFQVVSQLNPARKSIFIGDGHTDLATKNAVDYFIGFGGITIRQSVKSQADYYLTTQSLEPVYNLITR
jgi:phosphoserine phosphatase